MKGRIDLAAPLVVVEIDAGTAIVRLNRPHQRNTLTNAMLAELDSAVSRFADNTEISSVIFTGSEDIFASGADLRELRSLDSSTALEFARRGQQLMNRIDELSQLTIAAINGYCFGGGLDLALACDVRCAALNAVFSHPGAQRGIITGWGGTQRLPRLIGTARALELFSTARKLTSSEAYDWGLVSRVCDPVVECAREIAARYS